MCGNLVRMNCMWRTSKLSRSVLRYYLRILLERLTKTSENVNKNRRRSTLLVLPVCSFFYVYRICICRPLDVVGTVAWNVCSERDCLCGEERDLSYNLHGKTSWHQAQRHLKVIDVFRAPAYFRKQTVSSTILALLSVRPFDPCLLAWNQAAPARQIFHEIIFSVIYLL